MNECRIEPKYGSVTDTFIADARLERSNFQVLGTTKACWYWLQVAVQHWLRSKSLGTSPSEEGKLYRRFVPYWSWVSTTKTKHLTHAHEIDGHGEVIPLHADSIRGISFWRLLAKPGSWQTSSTCNSNSGYDTAPTNQSGFRVCSALAKSLKVPGDTKKIRNLFVETFKTWWFLSSLRLWDFGCRIRRINSANWLGSARCAASCTMSFKAPFHCSKDEASHRDCKKKSKAENALLMPRSSFPLCIKHKKYIRH